MTGYAQTAITNRLDDDKSIRCGVLVNSRGGALIPPRSWNAKLGRFLHPERVRLLLVIQEVVRGQACAPVEIEIERFQPVWNEVLILDAQSGG